MLLLTPVMDSTIAWHRFCLTVTLKNKIKSTSSHSIQSLHVSVLINTIVRALYSYPIRVIRQSLFFPGSHHRNQYPHLSVITVMVSFSSWFIKEIGNTQLLVREAIGRTV